jgi:pyruvate, orthophosphate dikinase
MDIFDRLERHYTDMCDTEFTIDQGKLWMLQTRVGKRTGRAALRMAVEMVGQGDDRGWSITEDEAIQRITEEHLDQVLHPQFAGSDALVLATGLAASPGAAVGQSGASRWCWSATRPRPTTCTACRWPRASSPPAAAW